MDFRVICLLNALLFLFAAGFCYRRGLVTLTSPVTYLLIFHLITWVFGPALVYFADFDFGWRYVGFTPSEGVQRRVFFLSNMYLFLAVATFYFLNREEAYDSRPSLSMCDRIRVRLPLLWILFGPLALYSIYLTAFSGAEMGELVDGRYVLTGTSGYILQAQESLLSLCILTLVGLRFNFFSMFPFLAFMCVRAISGYGRWAIVFGVLAALTTWCWFAGRRRFPAWFWMLLPLAYLVFTIIGENRSIVSDFVHGNQSVASVARGNDQQGLDRLDNLDFANFQVTGCYVELIPAVSGGYDCFVPYLGIFTEPIPRVLWADKPIGYPSLINDRLLGYGNFTSLTRTVVGDGWTNGGYLGVAGLALVWGYLYGMGYRWFQQSGRFSPVAILWIIITCLVPQYLRDGRTEIIKFLLFTSLPFGVMAFMERLELRHAVSRGRGIRADA